MQHVLAIIIIGQILLILNVKLLSLCLIQSIRAINGAPCETSAEDFANMVFDKIDINGDGKKQVEQSWWKKLNIEA